MTGLARPPKCPPVPAYPGDPKLTTLATATLALFVVGLLLAAIAWARRGGAVIALGSLFLLGTVGQCLLLWQGDLAPLGLNLASLEALSVLGLAMAALATLRSVHHTTRERDHAEDLHWDSMEAVRIMSDLAGRPGAELTDKLETMLRLGMGRFRMDIGGAWELLEDAGDSEPGEWLDVRALEGDIDAASRKCLGDHLVRAAKNSKPLYEVTSDPAGTRVFFGAPLRIGDRVQGAIGFSGVRPRKVRFAATENDLLTLMAQWLGTELERRNHAKLSLFLPSEAASTPPQTSKSHSSLNSEIERAETRLRRWIGTDATLGFGLGTEVPQPRARRIAPAVLLESLVAAAARVAPAGHIEVATDTTESQKSRSGKRDATLRVTATSQDVNATAFDALYATPSLDEGVSQARGLSLGRIENLLRLDGGDLSVTVEPGRRVVLTAFLPAEAASLTKGSVAFADATEAAERMPPETQPSR